MAEKAALPSLSLPKQRTHWSVFVVIGASALFLIMCGALYLVLQRQHDEEQAFAKRQSDRAAELKAKADADRAATERAKAEAKKKEAEAAAAAAAASAQKKAAQTVADTDTGGTKRRTRRSGRVAKAPAPSAPGTPAPPPPPAKPASKASRDIDDLLKSFK